MSTYKTVRGKEVRLGPITLTVDTHGSLCGVVLRDTSNEEGNQAFCVTEAEASTLYDLMGDVMEWESSRNATDNSLNRAGDKADAEMASGKADDERAHEGR